MIDRKYIIAIGLIILLIVIYYFYDDIRNIKKNLIPMYEKTMKLENKIEELEKKFLPDKKSVKKK
jgi:predicted Holliday junction resolvase-like endonuclease